MNQSNVVPSPLAVAGMVVQRLARTVARAKGSLPLGDDWDLWHRACAGDEASARKLVNGLTPQAHHLAMQILRNADDAQDMVQEAFLRLWKCRPSDSQGARLATFFNTIVINRCKTLLGQRRELSIDHESLVDLADLNQLAEHTAPNVLADVSTVRLQRALGKLPSRQRMVLVMWAYADLEVKEIAKAMELDINAAHQLLFRAKAALRQQLQGNST
jgi:RNA polymerase sigma-70 factor (ECF subfamily)